MRCVLPTPEFFGRFEKPQFEGQGTGGDVYKTRDKKEERTVAIKTVLHRKNGKSTLDDVRRCFEREVQMLLAAQSHANIIRYIAEAIVETHHSLQFSIVMECAEYDLTKMIKSEHNAFLSEAQIKGCLIQVCRAVRHLHSRGIVHCDLKCHNIVVTRDNVVKLVDFGLCHYENDRSMPALITTVWYRAPEVCAKRQPYTRAVDMWSLGCVMAELLGTKVVFPNNDDKTHLACIETFFNTGGLTQFVEKDVPEWRRHFFHSTLLQLLMSLFDFDPTRRLTIEQLCESPYWTAQPTPHSPELMLPLPASSMPKAKKKARH
jgi:serine/threonine protein kinase